MTLSLRARLLLGAALSVLIALAIVGVFAQGQQRRWLIARDTMAKD